MLSIFSNCCKRSENWAAGSGPASKLHLYKARAAKLVMVSSKKQVALDVLNELIKECHSDGDPKHNLETNLTPDDCLLILEKFHLKIDRDIKAALDEYGLETITSWGPTPKSWAKEKLLALHDQFSAQDNNEAGSVRQADLNWSAPVNFDRFTKDYFPKAKTLGFSASRRIYLGQVLAQLIFSMKMGPTVMSNDDYRDILQDFHASGALSEWEKNQLDLANLEVVSKLSLYDNARAKHKVMALADYFNPENDIY